MAQEVTLAATIPVRVPVARGALAGDLVVPDRCTAVVAFAHGSGSSRHSSRNQAVARALERRGLATLLIDLLTDEEDSVDDFTAEYRFDIPMLATRLEAVIDWLRACQTTAALPIGLFGASTGAAAALMAAAARPDSVGAVVSRGGRPDLAGQALPLTTVPTLLIVGGLDDAVIRMNREALSQMTAPVALEIVEGASHLFEEPGALDRVAHLAGDWFIRHLPVHASKARR